MGQGRPQCRAHRRCFSAGSVGGRRDRRARTPWSGRSFRVSWSGRNHRIPVAGRVGNRLSNTGHFWRCTSATGTNENNRIMNVPFFKEIRIGAYLLKQKLMGRKRYPLVLMLEPLFRCNLAGVGCGKIDYPDPILNQRLSVKDCLDAVDECGAPMVAIPGGEPLIHREIGEIVKGIVARKKFVSLCTNA